ncbi:hypothetical protein AA309_05510 [Microvirga vignae]|uniref:SF3 helicase domain-containing protein n=1 Tax=Microvirga vignae TaxID=1225564 RepID=A0A0H1RFG0_9HYPH|nr:phage/plasmid primase, P4 family [Microvirga vignae]KLK93938.1 hypothetical protein AA309_05510 [Microvirga vignae]
MNTFYNTEISAPRGLFTEDIVATYLAKILANLIRSDLEKGWHHWTGTHWQLDEAAVTEHVRSACRELAKGGSEDTRKRLGRMSFINNVKRLLTTDPLLRAKSSQWDKDPLLIACPDGRTIDLRSGQWRLSKPEDMITKLVAVAPTEEEHCPTWKRFVGQVSKEDADFAAFLKRLAGYCLTGLTNEQAITFIYGPGGNGKSVFIRTLLGIMGDHAKAASMSTFTAKKNDAHPEDIANLVGIRLVTASETEEGQEWASARLKELSGGDAISTRHLYGHRFTYIPIFKLVFAGNHAPNLRTVDQAMRRRLIVLPFNYVPPALDPHLEQTLRDEWSGILRWIINGCLEWQKERLQVPTSLRAATDDYLSVQDAFAEWFEERCELATNDTYTGSRELFRSWQSFAEGRGERAGTFSSFAERMQRQVGKGPEQIKRLGRKGYRGVRLK